MNTTTSSKRHDKTSLCPCQVSPHQKNWLIEADLLGANVAPSYEKCCLPYHTHDKLPETAEQLMRSRYAAFVLHEVDYIIGTTLPFQQSSLDKKSISDWSEETHWAGLEIIHHRAKVGKNHAQVEFKAWVQADDGHQCHHELSAFVRVIEKRGGQSKNNNIAVQGNKGAVKKWYFIDPTVTINITQKQPCICGSSEKFKRCCGVFLQ